MAEPDPFKKYNVFSDLIGKRISQRQLLGKMKTAVDWYRGAGRDVNKVNRKQLLRTEPVKKVTPNKNLEVGSMYIFNYDPKWKAILEVYDTHPVIIPIKIEKDRFLGINFHYLPFKQRAKLMDILYTISNNKRYDETTKLKISYQILQKVAKKKLYEPTIHMYLKRKVKSKMLYVLPSEWELALFLPIAKFNGPKAHEYKDH
jgi:hypothetical protein